MGIDHRDSEVDREPLKLIEVHYDGGCFEVLRLTVSSFYLYLSLYLYLS